MSRVDAVNQRYAASAALAQRGAAIIAVGDPRGARLNRAVRRLLSLAHEEGPGLWDDLVGAASSLRWRLLMQPFPVEGNAEMATSVERAVQEAVRLRGAVADEQLLEELVDAARMVGASDPPVAEVLRTSIDELGGEACFLIVGSVAARMSAGEWLRDTSAVVVTPGDLNGVHEDVDVTYVIGPPRFFPASIVTAPVTGELTFFMPSWFADRQMPRSAIAQYAEGAIRVKARVFSEGDEEDLSSLPAGDQMDEADLLPQPMWGERISSHGEPGQDEVEARKILLSGNLAMWLDDGERIRCLDPWQPVGERVQYIDVPAVRPGTYLLLREGATERNALYEAALARLKTRRDGIQGTQDEWKGRLQQQLNRLGRRGVIDLLRLHGVQTSERAPAWTQPNLVRPHSDRDFELLLTWLGLSIQPYFGNATTLRRAIYQASSEIRDHLETAVSKTDLSALHRDGHLRLSMEIHGFRGLIATRVLAVSPFTDIVNRHDARVLFEDRSGQWLE